MQILQVLVDVDGLSVQIRNDALYRREGLTELGGLGSHLRLVLLVGVRDVLKEVTKFLVIKDQPQYDGFVDIDRGELVTLALVDHLSELREVFRDLGRALLHDQKVLIANFLQERAITLQVVK